MKHGLARRLTLLLGMVVSSAALAHHPTITATATCVSGVPVINYTSTSWSPNPGEGENPLIQIYMNYVEVVVDSGAYVYPANSFSGSIPAPAGASAFVHAYAAAPWGNGTEGGQHETVEVALPADCSGDAILNGRFTGGGSQVRVGEARVTRGFTLHCDLLLSNNLEVNWGKNRFHMLEHLETVECSDSPDIIQAPPAAPLDTMVGIGRGRYNNVEGYTIEFILVDYGEPGGADRAALKIYQTSNPANVVLNVPLQLLTGGNLQAHYDQPHK